MIIDTLKNAVKYYSVHPLFEKAFHYIQGLDPEAIEMGSHAVDGDRLRAIFSNRKGMTKAESVAEFECHNQHIDIQYCIHGKEQFGWKPRENCILPNGVYDAEKDVQLYHDAPICFLN